MNKVQEAEFWSSKAGERARVFHKQSLSALSPLLRYAYNFRPLRRWCRALFLRLEGGSLHSGSLRSVLRDVHGVEVGNYSYGPILDPGCLPQGSRVGAFCSVAGGLTVHRRNKPVERPALHPFFYNQNLGFVTKETIQTAEDNPLTIGNDVWIGDRVTILSGCGTIGNGAVVAAGAVVTQNVIPYSIVGGVPAKLIRMRFSDTAIEKIESSQWWTRTMSDLLDTIPVCGSLVPTGLFFGSKIDT